MHLLLLFLKGRHIRLNLMPSRRCCQTAWQEVYCQYCPLLPSIEQAQVSREELRNCNNNTESQPIRGQCGDIWPISGQDRGACDAGGPRYWRRGDAPLTMQLWNVGLYPGGAGRAGLGLGRADATSYCAATGAFIKMKSSSLNNKDTVKAGEISAKTVSSNTKRSPGVGALPVI